jgi:hypothetical protein
MALKEKGHRVLVDVVSGLWDFLLYVSKVFETQNSHIFFKIGA